MSAFQQLETTGNNTEKKVFIPEQGRQKCLLNRAIPRSEHSTTKLTNALTNSLQPSLQQSRQQMYNQEQPTQYTFASKKRQDGDVTNLSGGTKPRKNTVTMSEPTDGRRSTTFQNNEPIPAENAVTPSSSSQISFQSEQTKDLSIRSSLRVVSGDTTLDDGSGFTDESSNSFFSRRNSSVNSSATLHSSSRGGAINSREIEELRTECQVVEANLLLAGQEVRRKEDLAFTMGRNDIDISRLQRYQAMELSEMNIAFQKKIKARMDRKEAKRVQRNLIRETKRRDLIILRQEAAAKAAQVIRTARNDKREEFEALVQHMEKIQEMQCEELAKAQNRAQFHERALGEMEAMQQLHEKRSSLLKKLQTRQTHQINLNKRINDQLREVHRIEHRHAKERFDLSIKCFDEVHSVKSLNTLTIDELAVSQSLELRAEKERLLAQHEDNKLKSMVATHQAETKRLKQTHRIAIRQMKIQQEQKVRLLKTYKSASQNGGSAPMSNAGSKRVSRSGSITSMDDAASDLDGSQMSYSLSPRNLNQNLQSVIMSSNRSAGANSLLSSRFDDDDGEYSGNFKVNNQIGSIGAMVSKHTEAKNAVTSKLQQELYECERSVEARMAELAEQHQLELEKLHADHQEEIQFMIDVQDKEIAMEEAIHDTELRMLVERRILNSVLETVDDGIINIDTTGIICRFNCAAEKIFGYKSAEVIGKNIKMLMPENYASVHDEYLNNYLTTGIKKVIGMGRRVFGKRKDDGVFPLLLSVSEVKEDGQHLFTGIARDLTEEVRQEKEAFEKDEAKKKELEGLISKLRITRQKTDELLQQMLPPSVSSQLMEGKTVQPQSFESATVFFLDVVGFTTLCSGVSPIATVSLLNAIYKIFDETIEKYDVYKVETIGDSYMIVSGVPTENGKRHATETATLALDILSKVHAFKFSETPDLKLRVRIGLNSGPLVAGVVGSKMPRYCLFGDTVNTASRMESTGAPMKIQISQSTYTYLKEAGGYHTSPRGEIDVKGKGKMATYFLTGKDGFPFELPPQ